MMKNLIGTLNGIALALLSLLVALVLAASGGFLRQPIQNIASAQLGRPVEMRSLHIHLLSFYPSATVKGLNIPNVEWAPEHPLANVNRLKVALNFTEFLSGNLIISNLEIDRGSVDIRIQPDGTTNFSSGKSSGGGSLPTIQRLTIGEAQINYADAIRKITVSALLSSQNNNEVGEKAFQLTGTGTLNNAAINLKLTGGSVLNTDSSKPYPFTASLKHAGTSLTASGQFARAFDLSQWSANATITGPNMADLYYITTVAFPLTKPYKLTGELRRDGDVFRFRNFNGKVGGSDLSGEMVFDTRPARLLFTANLHSNLLDPADAGVIFGGGEAPQEKRLLPNVPLEVSRLRSMDANVFYKASAINVSTLPLKEVDLHLVLDNGNLVINPLTLTLPQGRVSGTLAVDARQDVPNVDLDVVLSGAQLQDFLPSNTLAGPFLARVKLQGVGDSVHNAASHAKGAATVVLPGGEIRQAFAELMGVNIASGLGLLLTDDMQTTPLRCAIAHFEATDGLLRARHVIFDTGVVKATGNGTIDLETEALNMALLGQPKKPRILHLSAGVKITGTLLEPKLGADLSKAAAQAGTAATLGFLTPLAAILPFVSPGLGENANCAALLNIAESRGVPVKRQ